MAFDWPLEEWREFALKSAKRRVERFLNGGFMSDAPGPGGDVLFPSDRFDRAAYVVVAVERPNSVTIPDVSGNEHQFNKPQARQFAENFHAHAMAALGAWVSAATAIRGAADKAAIDAALASIPDPHSGA